MRLLALAGLVLGAFGLSVASALAAPSSPAPLSGTLDLAVVRTESVGTAPLMPGDLRLTGYVVSVSRDAHLWVVPKVDAWGPLARSLIVRIHNRSTGECLFEGSIADAVVDAGPLLAGQPKELMIDIGMPEWAPEATSGRIATIGWTFLATEFDLTGSAKPAP